MCKDAGSHRASSTGFWCICVLSCIASAMTFGTHIHIQLAAFWISQVTEKAVMSLEEPATMGQEPKWAPKQVNA